MAKSKLDVICDFCEEIFLKDTFVTRKIAKYGFDSRIIARTNLSVAIAGLGSLVPGYVLFLPARHCFTVGNLAESEIDDLQNLIETTREKMEKIYGPVILFEHGGVSADNCAGACVEHAHIHALPKGKSNFQKLLGREFKEIPLDKIDQLKKLADSDISYLYLETELRCKFAYIPDKALQSQYMRRLWAESLQQSDLFDWGAYYGFNNMCKTLSDLQIIETDNLI